MNLGLKDFFVGVIYLFVIFLPGATLLFMLLSAFSGLREAGPVTFLIAMGPAPAAFAFLGFSYFLGHLVSLVSSFVEDISWKWQALKKLRTSGEVTPGMRHLVRYLVEREVGSDLVDGGSVRRWCKVLLQRDGKPSYTDIERKDADRRFFRNILLVLLLSIFVFSVQLLFGVELQIDVLPLLSTLIVLTVLAGGRFVDQDRKFTKLLLESYAASRADSRIDRAPAITHAGGVIFRQSDKQNKGDRDIEYLLTRPRENGNEWVLPKGHTRDYETPELAFVREAAEEVGVNIEIEALLDVMRFVSGDETVTAACYLAESKGETEPLETRAIGWERYAQAREKLTHYESRRVLERAAHLLGDKGQAEPD